MKYWLLAVLITSPAISFAAMSDFNLNQIQVPGQVQDLFNTFGQIQINSDQNQVVQGRVQDLQNTVYQFGGNPQNWLSQVQNLWGTANDWLQNHFGVSLSQIIAVIGSFFIWIFELMIKLIKLIIPGVQ